MTCFLKAIPGAATNIFSYLALSRGPQRNLQAQTSSFPLPRCQSRVPRYRAPPPPSFAQTCNLARCEAPASRWLASCCTSILRCGSKVTCGLWCVCRRSWPLPLTASGTHPCSPFHGTRGPIPRSIIWQCCTACRPRRSQWSRTASIPSTWTWRRTSSLAHGFGCLSFSSVVRRCGAARPLPCLV